MSERNADGGDALTMLLVEDNPGDARYIREMLRDLDELSERAFPDRGDEVAGRPGGASGSEPRLVHESRLADSLDRLAEADLDLVLLDLDLPDSEGLETLETVVQRTDTVPIVVLTGRSDREVGMEALRAGAEEYLVKDEINANLLVRSVHHAIERKERELELERQRNQLATLNSLSELVHEVTHLAFEASTREEIERLACEQLAASDSYLFAWIGSSDRTDETVSLRAEAGVEGYLDGLTIRVDDTGDGRGPTSRAFRTGDVQVAQNVTENPDYERWRAHASEYGYQSAAAIPIQYEETIYGVLNIYTSRRHAFGSDERAVIGRLGTVIGHAINAVERKRALMSEEVVELGFRVEDFLATAGVRTATDGTISFDRTIPASNDAFLEYGTVTGDALDTLRELVEQYPRYESVSVLNEEAAEDGGTCRFELRLTEQPALATVAAHGGRVKTAEISDGDFRVVAQVPPSADVNRVVEAVQEEFPDASLVAKRQVTRTDESTADLESAVLTDLTDKQRTALESAYFSGFFEWPRDSSGEEVAESLGVSAPTFHRRARIAERKLLDTILDGSDDAEG